MNARRILLATLIAMLAVPAVASADKPKVPKVLVTLTDGAQNSKRVIQTATASFGLAASLNAGEICHGKVSFSAPTGTKTVKRRGKKVKVKTFAKKSGSLKLASGICSAKADLALPLKMLGETVKFTASFKGSAALKKFTKSAKHVVAAKQTPVTTPVTLLRTGPWTATQLPAGPGTQQWTFTVDPNNSIPGFYRITPLTVACETSGDYQVDADMFGFKSFSSTIQIKSNDYTASDHYNPGMSTFIDMTFSFHIVSPTEMTGDFTFDGLLSPGGSAWEHCTKKVENISFRYGAAA